MSYTAEIVLERFEEAGATLLAMKVSNCWPKGYVSSMPEVLRSFSDMVGVDVKEWRGPCVPVPSSDKISRMDKTYSWLRLIPDDRFVLRRLVCARSLTCPIHGKPKLSWRKLALQVGASGPAVKAWHGQGIDLIVRALNRPGLCARTGGPIPGKVPLNLTRGQAAGTPGVRRPAFA